MTDSDSTHVCPQTGCVRLAMVNRAEAKVYLVEERMMDYIFIRLCLRNCVCLKRLSGGDVSSLREKN